MSEENQQSKKKWREQILVFSLAFIAAAVIMYVGGHLAYCYLPNWEQRGQLGDMYGIVNTFFSGLAFGALVITLYYQRQELELQRKELVESRGVSENQVWISSITAYLESLNAELAFKARALDVDQGKAAKQRLENQCESIIAEIDHASHMLTVLDWPMEKRQKEFQDAVAGRKNRLSNEYLWGW